MINARTTPRFASAAALGTALLAGCSAAGSSVAPTSSAGAPAPRAGTESRTISTAIQNGGLLFVTEADNNAVIMYPESGTGTAPIGSITSGLVNPVAVAVDLSGNLFVASFSTSTVVEFAPPYTGAPAATYQIGANPPIALTTGPDGSLFVAAGSAVLEFPPNRMVPSSRFNVASPAGLAVDARGDLFVSDAASNDVEEFAAGSTKGKRLGLTGIESIAGIALDRSRNLLVADHGVLEPSHNGAVDVFAPGSTKPSRKFAFSQDTTAGVVLGSAADRLFVANFLTQGYNKLSVFDVNYPAGTTAKIVPVLVRGAGGIAVSPRAAF